MNDSVNKILHFFTYIQTNHQDALINNISEAMSVFIIMVGNM